jgi:quercetin dioxygenase-like cupin family protein
LVFPTGWYGNPHPTPIRQLALVVSGTVEQTVSDGEKQLAKPGYVTLLEDTSGEGHAAKNVGTEPAVVSMSQY